MIAIRCCVTIIIIACAVVFPVAGYAQTAENSVDNDAVFAPQSPVEVDPTSSDDAVRDRISGILEATGWFADVAVDVREGVVFLDGQAETEVRKEWARQLAAKTKDVVAVVNRMQVEEAVVWSLDPAIEELQRLARKAAAVLPLIALALLVLPLAWFAARMVAKLAGSLLTQRIQSPFLRKVVARAIAFPVFLLGLYVVLQVAGLTQLAISLVGGAGVIGIVLGFAFRDIAENFLSSLILSVRRPFRRGDFVEVAGVSGTIRSMNTRSTIIASVEGNLIHVPNSIIFKNTIENFTSSPERRGEFSVGIGYDAVVADAQDIILAGLKASEGVLDDPAPMVLVDELGASTINLKTYFWFDGHEVSPIKLKSALLRMVKSDLTQAGISMPDEAREVIFPEGVRVQTQVEQLPGPDDTDQSANPVQIPSEPVRNADQEDLKSDLLPPDNNEENLEGTEDDLLGPN